MCIILIHCSAVRDATWYPAYDIRVNMQDPLSTSKTHEKSGSKTSLNSACTLVYRGVIRQDTGEDWTNATLSLETANPTFNLKDEPKLEPWTIEEPTRYPTPRHGPAGVSYTTTCRRRSISSTRDSIDRRRRHSSPRRAHRSRSRSISRSRSPTRHHDGSFRSGGEPGTILPAYRERSPARAPVRHREAEVVTSGHSDWQTSATFRIAGCMSVPSDKEDRSVVIANIALDAAMSWVCVPKLDARVKVKVRTLWFLPQY